jgi:1-acyl-sn-glycerol-3-phosphate acyltransferase
VKSIRDELESSRLSSEYLYIKEKPSFFERTFKKIFEVYCKILFKIYCPLTVEGKENIPVSSFIFCSNHNSHMDSGILMVASGMRFKDFAMMAAKDYFFDNKKRKNFLGLLMNLIPINRQSNRKEMIDYLKACQEFLQKGKKVLIFYPEGTRSLSGKIQAFKKGPALTAVELGVPLVPAHIKGTFNAWPKGKIFMRPKRIKVNIGKPIYPAEFLNGHANLQEEHFDVYTRVTKELEESVKILGES